MLGKRNIVFLGRNTKIYRYRNQALGSLLYKSGPCGFWCSIGVMGQSPLLDHRSRTPMCPPFCSLAVGPRRGYSFPFTIVRGVEVICYVRVPIAAQSCGAVHWVSQNPEANTLKLVIVLAIHAGAMQPWIDDTNLFYVRGVKVILVRFQVPINCKGISVERTLQCSGGKSYWCQKWFWDKGV